MSATRSAPLRSAPLRSAPTFRIHIEHDPPDAGFRTHLPFILLTSNKPNPNISLLNSTYHSAIFQPSQLNSNIDITTTPTTNSQNH